MLDPEALTAAISRELKRQCDEDEPTLRYPVVVVTLGTSARGELAGRFFIEEWVLAEEPKP